MRRGAAGQWSIVSLGRSSLARRRAEVAILVASLLLTSVSIAPGEVARASSLNGDGSTTWYVGPGTGSSICDSTVDFTTGVGFDSDSGAIQRAVDTAASGDTIYLCDHVYDLTTGIVVDKDLTFYGQGQTTTEVSGGDAVRLFDATGHDIVFFTMTLRNGYTPDSGGAVTAANVTAYLATFTQNRANAPAFIGGGGGGAIYASQTVLAIGSTFTDNDALRADGGAIDASTGATITYSTFARNRAGGTGTYYSAYPGGGAVMVQTWAGYVRVQNSTFVDNTAVSGYGNAIYGPDIDITNGTFVGPEPGDYLISSWGNIGAHTYGYTSLTDTILYNGGCDLGSGAKLKLRGINLKADTFYCSNAMTTVTAAQLDLQPLADNGGPTWTVAIGESSVARDATTGLAGDGVCPSKYDQRAILRPQGRSCDIGAFELDGAATTWTVGPGTGSSICGPGVDFTTGIGFDSDYGAIQKAVDSATSGDTIYLCDHVYDLTTGIDVTAKDDLTFRGESTAGTEVSGGSAVRLFDASGRDITFIGLTLRDGQPADGQGGGAVRAAAVSVVGAVLTDNSSGAGVGGGAIIATGHVSATDATFSRNISVGYPGGGAIDADGGVSITRGTFSDNTASGVIGGGAIAALGASRIEGAVFSGNEAVVDDPEFEGEVLGGAVLVGGPLTIVDSDFIGNSATGGVISGGGALLGGTVDISGGTFRDNTTGSAGGAIVTAGGTIRDVLLVGNRTTLDGVDAYGGGAVFTSDEVLTVSGTTFEDNSAAGPFGGGAIIASPNAKEPVAIRVANSTFVGNAAPSGEGGAIRAGLLEITNGTFVDNTAATGGHVSITDGSGTGSMTAGDTIFSGGTCSYDLLTEVGLNLSTDASCPGTAATDGQLALGSLADNGGPTPTVALGASSVAIDASPECLVDVDQRGEPRPVGLACDIGAYEGLSLPASALVQQVNRDSDGTDLISGVPSITLGDTITDVVTVSGSESDGSDGYLDPTSGSVTFHYCYDASAAPTECTSGTWILAGSDEMDGGADPTDGTATATLAGWAPSGGWQEGWYLFSAAYDSSGGTYAGSETTGDTVGGLVQYLRPAVSAVYNGPWRISSSSPLSSVRIAAVVLPQYGGCRVRFSVSGGDVAFATPVVLDATTGADGVASVTVPGGVSGLYGLYDVGVTPLEGACTPLNADAGTLAILPGSVSNGSVGGGWTRTDGTRASFAHVVSVTSATEKVRGSTVTTTTTKGSLLWKTSHWRLKARIDQATTDGSSAWVRYPSCSSAYGVDVTVGDSSSGICGQFSGYATLQEWSTGSGTYVESSYGTVRYTVRVYDGGIGACRGRACNNATELPDWFGVRMWWGAGWTTPLPAPMSYAPVLLAGSSGKGNVANDGTSCGANGKKCRL